MTTIWKGSPNSDSNRKPIDRIVIHWFGIGTLSSANNRFQTANNSSAHYGISNEKIWQWVKEERVAYHAGNYRMNQRSIGIEHDATTTKAMSEATYNSSVTLLAEISERYHIPLDRSHVIGHKEVPRATQCPGTIDIDRLINMAKSIIGEMPEYWESLLRDDLNLDVKKSEGVFRSRVGEIKNALSKSASNEKKIKKLQKKFLFASGQATEFEEALVLAREDRDEFEKDLKETKDMVIARDKEIGDLADRVKELLTSIDPEVTVIIPKEEYERLTKHKTLDRHTTLELVSAVLSRYKVKLTNWITSLIRPEKG